MSQPELRVLQIDQVELTDFVNALIGSPVSAGATQLDQLSDVTLTAPGNGEHLVYNGSAWVNTLDLGFVVGDGIDATAYAGSPVTVAVDSTVARRDATNTFQQANTFTAAMVSNSSAAVVMNSSAPGLIFDESGAAADNQIWRVFASGTTLTFDIRNDAGSVTNNWLTVGRSGATAGDINLFGTALNFNGIPVIVGGSPYTGGGGGVTSSVGSPASGRVSYFTTDGDITGSANITTDGTDVTLGGDLIVEGSGPAIYIRDTNASANQGNWIIQTVGAGTLAIGPASDASPTIGSTAITFTRNGSTVDNIYINTANLEVGSGNEFRIRDDDQTDYVRMQHDGIDFITDFTNTADWKIRAPGTGTGSPNGVGSVWIARDYGSPTFKDYHTSSTNPTVRIGIGSPTTTNAKATLAILDNFSPGLVLRNTFAETEVAITAGNPGVSFTVDTDAFYTQSINATGSPNTGTVNKVIFTASGGPDGEVDFQQLPISRVKLKTLTRTQNATDAFSISTNMVYFCSIGSPSGGFIQIGGISGGVDGRIITIFNTNAGSAGSPSDLSNLESIIFEHEEATASASARILCPNRIDVTIGEYECITLIYDGTEERWRVMSTTGPMSGA